MRHYYYKRIHAALAIALSIAICPITQAESNSKNDKQNRKQQSNDSNRSSNSNRQNKQSRNFVEKTQFPEEFRRIDGADNNRMNPDIGAAETLFSRLADADFADGTDAPAGENRVSARAVSNALFAQDELTMNEKGSSAFIWQWGQFLDHDITLTPEVEPEESFPIVIPTGDIWFDPFNTGVVEMHFNRSFYEYGDDGARQQLNELTSWIDASNVYGSDDERAADLRTNDGTGKLRTSEGDLLPFNTNGIDNAPSNDASFFIAGDFRANEGQGLIAMHTLFVREHNFWAEFFAGTNPGYDGDTLYELARGIVTAEMQVITYNEFLPQLLGPKALKRYRGYRPNIDPTISNEFATAAYRFGHSAVGSTIFRLDAEGNEIEEGHLSLADGFFNPALIVEAGIEPVLRGLASETAQEIDTKVVSELRNFLFGPPGAGGLDLPSLNIQRGRDHGLPDYNTVRVAIGLDAVASFDEINPDPEIVAGFESVYDSVDNIDIWVGGLAEAHVENSMLGETFTRILADQFERLRDGDRFWYERYLPRHWARMVERQTLARIIRRNTDITWEIQNDVFEAEGEEEEL